MSKQNSGRIAIPGRSRQDFCRTPFSQFAPFRHAPCNLSGLDGQFPASASNSHSGFRDLAVAPQSRPRFFLQRQHCLSATTISTTSSFSLPPAPAPTRVAATAAFPSPQLQRQRESLQQQLERSVARGETLQAARDKAITHMTQNMKAQKDLTKQLNQTKDKLAKTEKQLKEVRKDLEKSQAVEEEKKKVGVLEKKYARTSRKVKRWRRRRR